MQFVKLDILCVYQHDLPLPRVLYFYKNIFKLISRDMGDENNKASGSFSCERLAENVEWSVDAASSSEDEIDTEPIVNTIPRFDEADRVEKELQQRSKDVEANQPNSMVDTLMKKSIIGPGFEQLRAVPTSFASDRFLRKLRKNEREKTKGPGWYNIPIQEVTEEVKNDLTLLKMRSILDPKHVYKKNNLTHTPKYFQFGKVLEAPADFYNGRIPKSQRKKTLVDELLADAEARAYHKKKYKSIVDTSRQRRTKRTSGSGEKTKKKRK